MRAVPIDLLDGVIANIGDEQGLIAVGEVALIVDTEAGGGGALRDGSRVRSGQANRLDLVFNNVEILPAGRLVPVNVNLSSN